MVGTQRLLSDDMKSLQAEFDGIGCAWRIRATLFTQALANDRQSDKSLTHYVGARTHQLAQSAAFRRVHSTASRLARRLILTGDLLRSEYIQATHETFARILGVRRATVTLAAIVLEGKGFIQYTRGRVTVLNRKVLENAALRLRGVNRQRRDV